MKENTDILEQITDSYEKAEDAKKNLLEYTDATDALSTNFENVASQIIPEPKTDGPIVLMKRAWALLKSSHTGMAPPIRSWKADAEKWHEDFKAWVEANPDADN